MVRPILWRGDSQDRLGIPIEKDFDLVRSMKTLDVLVSVTSQEDADIVIAIPREQVGNQRTTSSAQRKAFDMVLLRDVGTNPNGPAVGLLLRSPHRHPADLLSGIKVSFQQGR